MRPDVVFIGPHTYQIKWDEAALNAERVREDEVRLQGAIRYRKGYIVCDPTASPSHQRRELLHEVLHGILDVTGWNNVAPEKPDGDDFLVRLDSMLLDVIRRNPQVMIWLQAADE